MSTRFIEENTKERERLQYQVSSLIEIERAAQAGAGRLIPRPLEAHC